MSLISEEIVRNQTLRDVARMMMLAARTAPKGRGRDTLTISLVEGDILEKLAEKMEEIGERENAQFFIRDAQNVRHSSIIVFIGSQIKAAGVQACGYCGYQGCEDRSKHPEIPCCFNTVDLGIALGSAASIAANFRADNRIMFSVGKAALELGLFDNNVKLMYGIPLTSTCKSPFFDRK